MSGAGTSGAVLVIEDDESIRFLLRFILEQEGWRVLEAATGSEGLQAIARGEVTRLVLLDNMLPGVDGFTLLERFRTTPRWEGVPIVMLSAKGDAATVERAKAAGAVDYLPKPFDPEDLVQLLRRWKA